MKIHELLDKDIDAIGDDHIGSNNEETPLKEGAFDLPDPEKVSLIQKKGLWNFGYSWYGFDWW